MRTQSLAGQTILVVEDEPLVTLELEHALSMPLMDHDSATHCLEARYILSVQS
jgi:hypothetical protein